MFGNFAAADNTAFRRWARPAYQYAVDALIWAVAIPVTTLLRYDLDVDSVTWSGVFWAAAVAVVAQGVLGLLFGLYRRRWRYGSFDELLGLAATVIAVGTLLTLVVFAPSAPTIPRSSSDLPAPQHVPARRPVRCRRRLLRRSLWPHPLLFPQPHRLSHLPACRIPRARAPGPP